MAAITQWHSGGWTTRVYGDFSGKGTEHFTRFHSGGWFMRRYGSFSGKEPDVPPEPGKRNYVGLLMDANHIGRIGM